MKSLRIFRFSFTLLFCVILCGIVTSASAQTTKETPQWRTIHLQYIPPDLMANYLDPTNYPIPAEYRKKPSPYMADSLNSYSPYRYGAKFGGTPPNTPQKTLDLKLKFDNFKKEISIYSTQDVFNMAKWMASSIDKPIPKFDIVVKEIAMDAENLQLFQSQPQYVPSSPLIGSTPTFYTVTNGGLHTLDKLIAQKKATILKTSNLSVYRNFSGAIESSTSTAAKLEMKDADNNFAPVMPDRELFLERHFEVQILGPYTNNDNTITVHLIVASSLVLTHHDPSPVIYNPYARSEFDRLLIKNLPEYPPQDVNTITIPNDTTLLLTGFTSTSLDIDEKDQNAALFITIKRHG